MKNFFFTYIVTPFLNILELQLFITTISLPLLIAWGIPISLLSIAGNIIFLPFLIATLFLSSMIFFGELLHISTVYVQRLLEKIIEWWFFLMQQGTKSVLVAFKKPPLVFLFTFVIISLVVTCALLYKSKKQRIFSYFFLLLLFFIGNKLYAKTTFIEKISCNTGFLYCIQTQRETIIIDPGMLGSGRSGVSYTDFTLIPTLITKTGHITIDHIIISKLNKTVLQALEQIVIKMNIKNIYIPDIPRETPKLWKQYIHLLEKSWQENCIIHTIKEKTNLIFENENFLNLTPVHMRTSDIRLQIEGQIDNTIFPFYSPD